MLGRATVSAVRVPVDHMTEIDPSVVQLQGAPDGLVNAWRSNTHIAMLFVEPDGRLRLAVSRTAMTAGGHERQHDEMTRTELLRVKREFGRIPVGRETDSTHTHAPPLATRSRASRWPEK